VCCWLEESKGRGWGNLRFICFWVVCVFVLIFFFRVFVLFIFFFSPSGTSDHISGWVVKKDLFSVLFILFVV
jgi:hypothetical protein